ncbi:GAF and ANTAR domain-containing protein [Kineococcus gynurae]|uniref:GAF and ANTAR domain-containing protein n=1 Tax=Kineococcus gynurae TaxID=452979 RepID=A0ABV5LRV7_9ACTN
MPDPDQPDPAAAPAGGPGLPATSDLTPAAAIAQLSRIFLGEPLGQVLQRVADLVVASVPGADEVSVTLIDRDRPYSAAFSGSRAAVLDERQYASGFGPCVDAAQTGRTVVIADTRAEDVYTDFAALGVRHGVHGVTSVPLPMPMDLVGAINVYRTSAGPLPPSAQALVETFAGYAAVALANATLYAISVDQAENLRIAMQTRATIEQAKGVLMATLHCTADEAFEHLSRRSQRHNRKLRDIAAEVVEGVSRHG